MKVLRSFFILLCVPLYAYGAPSFLEEFESSSLEASSYDLYVFRLNPKERGLGDGGSFSRVKNKRVSLPSELKEKNCQYLLQVLSEISYELEPGEEPQSLKKALSLYNTGASVFCDFEEGVSFELITALNSSIDDLKEEDFIPSHFIQRFKINYKLDFQPGDLNLFMGKIPVTSKKSTQSSDRPGEMGYGMQFDFQKEWQKGPVFLRSISVIRSYSETQEFDWEQISETDKSTIALRLSSGPLFVFLKRGIPDENSSASDTKTWGAILIRPRFAPNTHFFILNSISEFSSQSHFSGEEMSIKILSLRQWMELFGKQNALGFTAFQMEAPFLEETLETLSVNWTLYKELSREKEERFGIKYSVENNGTSEVIFSYFYKIQ